MRRAQPRVDMHAANKLRPIVVDEGLVDLETLLEARELGYTGLALKSTRSIARLQGVTNV